MKDTKITAALKSIDGETELPVELAARIRLDMVSELDRVMGTASIDIAPSDEPSGRRPTWLLAAAAAVVVVLAVGLAALAQIDREPAVSVEVEEPVNHLRACARFQLDSGQGDSGWFEVLTSLVDAGGDDAEYRGRLGGALDDLADSPGSAVVADDLRTLAAALRSDLTPGDALDTLVAIDEAWSEVSAVRCLR